MTLNQLAVKVAKEFNIKPSQLKGGRGRQQLVMARWAFIWLATWFECADPDALAKWMGLSPGAVHYANRTIGNDLKNNPRYRDRVYKLGRKIDPEFSA